MRLESTGVVFWLCSLGVMLLGGLPWHFAFVVGCDSWVGEGVFNKLVLG